MLQALLANEFGQSGLVLMGALAVAAIIVVVLYIIAILSCFRAQQPFVVRLFLLLSLIAVPGLPILYCLLAGNKIVKLQVLVLLGIIGGLFGFGDYFLGNFKKYKEQKIADLDYKIYYGKHEINQAERNDLRTEIDKVKKRINSLQLKEIHKLKLEEFKLEKVQLALEDEVIGVDEFDNLMRVLKKGEKQTQQAVVAQAVNADPVQVDETAPQGFDKLICKIKPGTSFSSSEVIYRATDKLAVILKSEQVADFTQLDQKSQISSRTMNRLWHIVMELGLADVNENDSISMEVGGVRLSIIGSSSAAIRLVASWGKKFCAKSTAAWQEACVQWSKMSTAPAGLVDMVKPMWANKAKLCQPPQKPAK